MTLRKIAGFAAVATLLSVGAIVPMRPAGALEGEAISFEARPGNNQTFERDPVIGMAPYWDDDIFTPEDCATLAGCELFAIEMKYPKGFDREIQEFFLRVTIAWEQGAREADTGLLVYGQHICIGPSPCLAAAQGNDIDAYFYKQQETEDPEDEPGTMEYVELGTAATARQPERFKLFGGEDTYFVTIVNFSGANLGYTINLEFIDATIEPVGDLLGLELTGPSGGGEAADFSQDDTGPAFNLPSLDAAPDIVGGVGGIGGISFGDFGEEFAGAGADDFAASLEGTGPGPNSIARQTRQAGPASKPSNLLLWLAMGLVPAALATGAGIVFFRRRPTALSISFGRTQPAG